MFHVEHQRDLFRLSQVVGQECVGTGLRPRPIRASLGDPVSIVAL